MTARSFVLVLISAIAVVSTAMARPVPLPGGLSPDGVWSVVAVKGKRNQPNQYEIVRRADRVAALRLESSYRDDWRRASSATVTWRSDSRFVAVDELIQYHTGTVFLVQANGSQLERAPLDTKSMGRITGVPWVEFRPRFLRFVGQKFARLILEGMYYTRQPAVYVELTIPMLIRLSDGHPVWFQHSHLQKK